MREDAPAASTTAGSTSHRSAEEASEAQSEAESRVKVRLTYVPCTPTLAQLLADARRIACFSGFIRPLTSGPGEVMALLAFNVAAVLLLGLMPCGLMTMCAEAVRLALAG